MTEPWPDWAQHYRQGAADPGSPWRNLALGTLGEDGTPQIRTVVLRRFEGRILEVHTDTRSAKYGELRARPAATLHGWDPASRVQLRASGDVSLHVCDTVAAQAWSALAPTTRGTYRITPGPGTSRPSPEAPTEPLSDADAQRIFCVIRLTIQTLDWLHLAQGSHRRARITWAQGTAKAMWLVP